MRILVLHSKYRSGPASGENRVVADEAALLRQAGHAVRVVAPQLEDAGGLDLAAAGLRTIWSHPAARTVRRSVEKFCPDVVHCHNLFPALSPSVIQAIPRDVPVIMTLHNYRLSCLPGTFFRDGRTCEDCLGRAPWPGVVHCCYQDSRAASAALASSLTFHKHLGTFRRIKRFLAISRFVREKHIESGVPADRIVVKPHFTWGTEQRTGPGSYFLSLGRLSPEKGLKFMLHSFGGLKADLLVLGEGPEERSLHAMAPVNARFERTVPPDEVPALIRRARAVVIPSAWHEPAGRVVIEAYAAGVPVIASRVGALPELVHDGETGLLRPPGDEEGWRRAFEHLLDDEESIRMGSAAFRAWDTNYRPDIGLANLEAAYRWVLT
jgi:glycosyltransferase involved in cell wall biosynthesis